MRYRFARYKFRFLSYRYPQKTFCMFTRRLEDVLNVTTFSFQDVLRTTWRRIQNFLRDTFKTSSRRFRRQKVVTFKMFSRHLGRPKIVTLKSCLLKMSPRHVLKTSSRLLQVQQMFPGTYPYPRKIKNFYKPSLEHFGFTQKTENRFASN